MNSHISVKQVKRNVGLSLTAQIISLAVSLITNLILPKFISEYQYAMWQTYNLYVGYVGILHFGLLDGIVLRYSQYDYNEIDKEKIRSQFKTLICMTVFFFLLSMICTLCFANQELKLVFVMVSIAIILKNILTYTSYSFQITNRINDYVRLTIGYRLFFGIGIIAILAFGMREFYYLCIIDAFTCIFGFLYSQRKNEGMYFGRSLSLLDTLEEAKKNISAGIMLTVANFSSSLITGSAKMIIQWHWNKLIFGKVAFAFSISNLFLTFVNAISVVLFPSLKRIDEDKLSIIYKKIRNIMSPFFIGILILYYPGCWILRVWLPKYSSSLDYLGILMPMILYSSKRSLLTNNYLKALRKEKTMLVINLVSVFIAIILFAMGAYVFDDLRLVLGFIVLSIMICSMASEYVVMNTINIYDGMSFVGEILMTLIFIISTLMGNEFLGFILYLISAAIYMYIYRDSIRGIMKK